MKHYCQKCNGNGKIRDLNKSFWKKIDCPVCIGHGGNTTSNKTTNIDITTIPSSFIFYNKNKFTNQINILWGLQC